MLNLLEDYDFYKRLAEILPSLFVKSVISNHVNENIVVITPGLVKATIKFIYNLTILSKEEVICSLQEGGLIKLIFR